MTAWLGVNLRHPEKIDLTGLCGSDVNATVLEQSLNSGRSGHRSNGVIWD